MLKGVRAAFASLLVVVFLTTAAIAGGKKATAVAAVPGEDDYRSATGYTVAVMEHCKAINRLARGRGGFNVELAREHASEVERNAQLAARHLKGFDAALGADQRTLIADVGPASQSSQADVTRLSASLATSLKSPTPDRKAVGETVTELYLAAKDLLAAHKAAGKTLGIKAATPPRKATPRKPRSAPAGEAMGQARNQ
jgi:hypothetical protein